MAESVRVVVRCRPLNQRELRLNSKICVEMVPSIGQCLLQTEGSSVPKAFTFDGVYFMDSTAEQIYNDIVYPLVESVIEGYNGTVFAYGQTGSGKTFSMQGDQQFAPAQRGVIPRAFEHIFEAIATTAHTKFLVHVSYLEIYNEEIRDLLGDNRQKLDVKEHPEQGVYVAGLSMHVCHDVSDCEQLMITGFNSRHVGATLMNKDSSRSHSIFTMYVEALNESGNIRMGKLNLVDLAGSERQAKTGTTGERFKEATKINLSLSALGNVISALVDSKSTHIPYRDSKLTRLLQDSLGGNTKTVMVACVSPSDNNYDETLSTLRYANRAKNIKNKPHINEDPKDALLREYQAEIERLKQLVQQPAATTTVGIHPDVHHQALSEFERERQKLRVEFELAMQELKTNYEREQKNKEKLQSDLAKLREQYEKANNEIEQAKQSEESAESAKRRIEQLQQQMVGGEQADNEALKQKRARKIKEAEKKMKRLAEALEMYKDKEDPLLHVYTSTQEKLDALVQQYNQEKQKVQALESDMHDLSSEFELDRLDYLETIRKQDQQLKLFHQILERVQPAIHKDCNYANIERVKREAVWNVDAENWTLPELTFRQALPSAGAVSPNARAERRNGKAEKAELANEAEEEESRLKKRLDQSMDNDFVQRYFKPITRQNILDKYNPEKHRILEAKKIEEFKRRNQFAAGVVYTDSVYGSAGDDQQHISKHSKMPNNNHSSASKAGTSGGPSPNSRNSSDALGASNRPISGMQRKAPPRLEAIQVVRNKSFT